MKSRSLSRIQRQNHDKDEHSSRRSFTRLVSVISIWRLPLGHSVDFGVPLCPTLTKTLWTLPGPNAAVHLIT